MCTILLKDDFDNLFLEIEVMEYINGFEFSKIDNTFVIPKMNKRDCFSEIMKYLNSEFNNQICAVYGLRRTGKSTLLKQSALSLSTEQKEKAIFIKCDERTDFYNVIDFIIDCLKKDYKYFFIDEITYAESFQSLATILSDDFVSDRGAKIIVSGTDSLGLELASRDLMYDRIKFITTSYTTYGEYKRLKNISSIEDYIRHGSTLSDEKIENYKVCKEYIDTAIVDNIIHSLEKFESVSRRSINMLTEKYEYSEIKCEIEKGINKYSQARILKAINKTFHSAPLSDTKDLAKKNLLNISDINFEKINERIANLLGCNRNTSLILEDIKLIYDYLERIGVYTVINQYADFDNTELCFHSNSGLFHSSLKYCLESIKNSDDLYLTSNEEIKNFLITKAYQSAVGKIMENIVIGDVFHILCKGQKENNINNIFGYLSGSEDRWYVGKIVKEINKQTHKVDLVVKDNEKHECFLFEIKRSTEIDNNQTYHLENRDFLNYITNNYGEVNGRYVLYCGQTTYSNGIPRINIDEFLINLYRNKDKIYTIDSFEKLIGKNSKMQKCLQ